MPWDIFAAQMITGLVAGGTVWLWQKGRLQRKLKNFFQEHDTLFSQGQGWSLLIAFAAKLAGPSASTRKLRQVSQAIIGFIPTSSPLWESAGELFSNQESAAWEHIRNGQLKDIFSQELSYAWFCRQQPVPTLMAQAIRLDMGRNKISLRVMQEHAGYSEYLKFALTQGKSRTFWPGTERPATDEMLLYLLRQERLPVEQLPDLLLSVRKKYRIHHPGLIHPDMSPIASLTCNLLADPPEEVAVVFGDRYPEILRLIPGIPGLGDISRPACIVHHVRPMQKDGIIACPVCFEPSNLRSNIGIIAGVIGSGFYLQPDELLVPLSLPLSVEMLLGLEEIRIGHYPGFSGEAILDQALAVCERLTTPLPVRVLDTAGLGRAHQAMLKEWNHRVATGTGDSV